VCVFTTSCLHDVARSKYGTEIVTTLFTYATLEVRGILLAALEKEVQFTVTDICGYRMASAIIKVATFTELNKYCEILFNNAIA